MHCSKLPSVVVQALSTSQQGHIISMNLPMSHDEIATDFAGLQGSGPY